MMFKKLISFCLVVAMVRSDTTEEISSFVVTTPKRASGIRKPTLELKKEGSNPKSNGISPHADSLFGLGIGANLQGVHAGVGIGHENGGYGDLGQGFDGEPGVDQDPQYPHFPTYFYAQGLEPPVMIQWMLPARPPTCYRPPCA